MHYLSRFKCLWYFEIVNELEYMYMQMHTLCTLDMSRFLRLNYFTPVSYSYLYINRLANKKAFFYRAVQYYTCKAVHILLIYLLMILPIQIVPFFSIDIKVSREPVVDQSHLPNNAGFLDKHWTFPNLHLTIIGISYHIYTHISATRCKSSLVTHQNNGVFKLSIVAVVRNRSNI